MNGLSRSGFVFLISMILVLFSCHAPTITNRFERIKYNNHDLVVDLGVGLWAWPLPMDYDADGDYDLLVSCPDKPYNGIYFFENREGDVAMPTFLPGVRLCDAQRNITPSYIGSDVHLLTPAHELDIRTHELVDIYPVEQIHTPDHAVRANQWRVIDFEGDGDLDILVGVGDWSDYGWDDAFDENGVWRNGPLHGYVYLICNEGSVDKPTYAEPRRLQAEDKAIDVYGMPSPNMADFDDDGDLDLICGEFLDRFTWFENIGTRGEPNFAAGRFLQQGEKILQMDLQMIVPVALDWDKDGDVDLIVGQEDGRVAFVENTGVVQDAMPQFRPPRFFQQRADEVKFGALATPFSYDWDGDGDDDLISGNTAGYIGFIENLGGHPPAWAAPVLLQADGKDIRIMAGSNGSIQGPCEAKWGYTTLNVADWDHDGLPDIILNSIWGKVLWCRNVGSKRKPQLAAPQPVKVQWPEGPLKPAWIWWQPAADLVTQWRTTPAVVDWNEDGLNDLIMLDHEGYLAFFKRRSDGLDLMPGARIFRDENGSPLHLNAGRAGKSGRRKFYLADWDLDGRIDLLVNGKNIDFYRNVGEADGTVRFKNMGALHARVLAGHTTSPTIVDWDKNGIPDLLVGAEDGFFYHLENPHQSLTRSAERSDIQVIAHRGASSVAPQNTLAAFRTALELGADYFELDVHLSLDDSLVVIHNETVDETTDGEGRVDQLTYAHLQALDAGSWFDPLYREERLPTLRQALLFAKAQPIRVCIEIKARTPGIVGKVEALVKELDMQDRVIIFSFDYSQIAEAKERMPHVAALFLVGKMRASAIDSAVAIGAEAVGAGSEITPELVKLAHKKGVDFWKWTVNDYWELRQMVQWGVDGIITDYPQRLTLLIR